MNRYAAPLLLATLLLVASAVVLTPAAAQPSVQIQLAEPDFHPTGEIPTGATRGDFNGDTHVDVAVSTADSVTILLGDGTGALAPSQRVQVPGDRGIEAGDIEGDGLPDLFVLDWATNSIHVLSNDGLGQFSRISPIGLDGVSAVLAFDLDQDGNLDVVATSDPQNLVTVFLGDGAGSFEESQASQVGLGPIALALADVDGTSGLDILAASVDGSISILPGLGSGEFGPATSFQTDLSPTTLEVSDVDGDGSTDLAMLQLETNQVFIAYGSDDGFEPPRPYVAPDFPNSVALSDLTGDGRVDVVAGAWEGGVTVLVNNGNRNIGPALSFDAGTGSEFVTTADIDSDGRVDVVATEDDDSSLMVLRNLGTAASGSRLVGPDVVDLGVAPSDGISNFESAARRVMVTNPGPDPVEIRQARVDGSRFWIDEDTCSGISLPAGRGCSLRVAYGAEGPGAVDNGTLVVPSNAASGDLVTSLSGEWGGNFPGTIGEVPDDPLAYAIDLSSSWYVPSDRRGAVVLARADIFADSLAGSVLTSLGPLLYTGGDVLDAATATEIQRVLPLGATVYMLGGPAALSPDIESTLTASGYTVRRLAGPSRVETALAIAEEASRVLGTSDQINLARADAATDNPTAAWADAVAVGGLASAAGQPVLLTQTEVLHPAVAAWLASRPETAVRIVGGADAIANSVEATLAGGSRSVTRSAGPNRYATAAAIADAWPDSSFFRYVGPGGSDDGWAFTLALSGRSGELRMPILLTELDRVPAETCAALGSANALRTPTARTTEAVRAAITEGC